jgi:hypothetical protein
MIGYPIMWKLCAYTASGVKHLYMNNTVKINVKKEEKISVPHSNLAQRRDNIYVTIRNRQKMVSWSNGGPAQLSKKVKH